MEGRVVYALREVHYNDNGHIWAYTDAVADPYCPTLGDDGCEEECLGAIQDDLNYMLKALSKPILDLDTLVCEPADFDTPRSEKD